MKKSYMFFVFDVVGNCAITGPIPSSNFLTAAIGFREAYINNKESKKKYNYTQLKLCCYESFLEDENGCLLHDEKIDWELKGKDVISYIQQQMQALGVDDNLLDETNEEEK